MQLEQLLLTKEEIPILKGRFFTVPIYPLLLRTEIEVDPHIAHDLFPQAAEEWYAELTEYASQLTDAKEKKWLEEVWLQGPVSITEKQGRQFVSPLEIWEDGVEYMENGFARVLSINRNAGGTLFWHEDVREEYIHPPFVQFSKDKFDAYKIEEMNVGNAKGVFAHAYDHHNIDHYPGALFLRNWAILYLNEAMRQTFQKESNF
ncbi:MAG: hypothetical protein Q8R37_02970 [Nanoarchaeota archaeon]|nr:hypothetical protein [Nanoarchaeota archaeon]